MIRIKQHDHSDCGVACLASVAAHFRLQVPIARLRQYAGTGMQGTTMLGLQQAAQKLGFHTRAVRTDTGALTNIPLPAVAQLVSQQGPNHYVVMYKVTAKYVLLMDPSDGNMHRHSWSGFGQRWTGVLLLLMPGANLDASEDKLSLYHRFWILMKPHKSVLLQAFAGALVYTLLGFSTSLYIQKLTDYVFSGGNTNLLNLLSSVMLILLALQLVIAIYKDLYLTRTGQLIDLRLILGYYRHLFKLPQDFFDSMQAGEILSRIGDAMKIRTFLNTVLLSLLVNVLILVFSFALMFTLYWKLALVMLAIIPFYGIIYFAVNLLNKRKERKVMEAAAQLESQLVESLNTVSTIKQFGIEAFAYLKTESAFVRFLKQSYDSALNHIFSINSTSFVSGLFTIILLWAGAHFVIGRIITPGELLSFYAIVGYFTAPVSRLINANKEIQKALIAADRLFEITDLEQETEKQVVHRSMPLSGDIVFTQVSFGYKGRLPLFQNLCLKIPRGAITAILGESGSGKSTLAKLLQKLYPIANGQITFGGHTLKHVATADLKKHLAVVAQQVHLFSGNVIENIALGDLHPDMQKIEKLCGLLGLSNFIEAMPDGFFTQLGENGALLSGGQKQRIAIARALYREPSVLILDEATSNLDSHSEKYIMQAILQFSQRGDTVIMIAHRLSSIRHAQHIVYLKEGKVVEEGTHKELLARKSHYYWYCEEQLPARSLSR